MVALILTAGEGTRIQNVRACRSKCMLTVNGKPILSRRMEQISVCPELKTIYIVIHHDETEIQQYFGDDFQGIPIVYAVQQGNQPGIVNAVFALTNNEELLSEDVLFLLGDEYYGNLDINELYKNFDRHSINVIAVPTNDTEKIKQNYSIRVKNNTEITEAVEKPKIPFNNLIGTGTALFPSGFLKLYYKHFSNTDLSGFTMVDFFSFALKNSIGVKCSRLMTAYYNINTTEELYKLNHNEKEYPEYPNIISMFEDSVKHNGDKTAVISDNESITYDQLELLSGILCRNLTELGIKKNSTIALLCGRTVGHIVSMLAVLKLGCHYVPLDENLPIERLEYMLKKSDCALMIKTASIKVNNKFNVPVEIYENLLKDHSCKDTVDYAFKNESDSGNTAAYIIFTSGSTGKPKGVVIRHNEVLNLVWAMKGIMSMHKSESLNVGVLASFSFDLSVQQIYPSLLLGHTLVIIPSGAKTHLADLVRYLNLVDICDCTPLILNMINDYLDGFPGAALKCRHLFSAGEKLHKSTAHEFFRHCPDSILSNCYGPTECTVETLFFHMNRETENDYADIPLGKPIINTHVYILDDSRRIVAPGQHGELWISGKGVGKGYINDLSLTEEAFLPDLLNKEERMYKTGDITYFGKDGNIYFVGRKDKQIKYKGYRIEIDEIEKTIEQTEGVSSCHVLLMSGGKFSDKKLVAYFSLKRGPVPLENILENLSKKLPIYMIPQAFATVKEFNLNSNGKLDITKLPDYETAALKLTSGNALRIEDEDFRTIIDIAESLLNSPIEKDQSLISLGFDSLMLILFLSKVENVFGIQADITKWHLKLCLSDIYEIVESQKAQNRINGSIPYKGRRRAVNALPMQTYLVNIEQKVRNQKLLNIMLYIIPLNKIVNPDMLNESYHIMLKKHNTFSMNFKLAGNRLKFTDASGATNDIIVENDADMVEAIAQVHGCNDIEFDQYSQITDYINDLSWNSEILMRVFLYSNGKQNVLLLAAHHIVFDYLSLIYILHDLDYFYEMLETGENFAGMMLTKQNNDCNFASYIQNYNLHQNEDRSNKAICFWHNEFKNVNFIDWKSIASNILIKHKVCNLQYKKRHIGFADYEGSYEYSCVINKEHCNRLRNFCRQNEIGEFSVLFSLFLLMIHSNSPVNRFPVLFYTSGRNDLRPVDTVGFFSHLLCCVWDDIGYTNFKEFINCVTEKLKYISENENCISDNEEKEIINRILSESAIFDYQQLYNVRKTSSSLWNLVYPLETAVLSNIISFRIFDYGDYAEISILYQENNLSHKDIESLITEYIDLLDKFIK